MGRRDLAGHRRDHHICRGFVLDDFVHVVGIRSFQGSAGNGELVVGARISHRHCPILSKGGPSPSSKWSNTADRAHSRVLGKAGRDAFHCVPICLPAN